MLISDRRFDPLGGLQLLLDIAEQRSLEPIFEKVIGYGVEQTEFDVCQIWLVEKGDLCATCRHQSECADQSRCLHMVAGKGRLALSSEGPQPYEDRNARIPLNLGPLGEAASTGELISLRSADIKPGSIAGLEWALDKGIGKVGIRPINFKGEALGALVGGACKGPPDSFTPWGHVFADHIGAAIANARAFEEIKCLKTQLELQNSYLQEEVVEAKAFGDLVGQSAALRNIVSEIDVVATTEASVLILGETGTGKELVAHEIHRRSDREEGPLVRVNCASIPRDLFESEFFGHVRGSFTGAVKDRAGRFEMAEGGTLFLDEVGEIPLEIQSKLLRVLQEKRYERVGDDRTRHADVRILAATNRDLKKAVAGGRFREDLYYRLNVFPVQVPPLRRRMEDIPLLAKHFVDLSVKELKCVKPKLTRAGIAKLQSYDWPGNVRELRNVIERAVILARGGVLEFELPISAQPANLLQPGPQSGASAEELNPDFLTEVEVERFERENLLKVLEAVNWRIKGANGAAELMGVKPTTLVSRIEKWGLTKPER